MSGVTPLEIVTFKWTPRPGYRSVFGPETVNTLKRMIARNYPKPHRLTCFTDDPTGIDQDVRVLPIWNDYASLPSPHGQKNPSCYRRLKMYSAEAAELIGPEFVALDLDCVVTGDLTPIFDRDEDFVIYGDTNPRTHYNGSLVRMKAGARKQVWEQFDPATSPRQAMAAGFFGSDQAWVSYCLGGQEKRYTARDGVYSFRNEIRASGALPKDARLVVFHGSQDPWTMRSQDLDWVREHYR